VSKGAGGSGVGGGIGRGVAGVGVAVGDGGGQKGSVVGHDGGLVDGGGNNGGLVDGSGVDGVSGLGHDGVESVDGVSGVVDGADGAVGLHKAVLSLDDITVAGLRLALLVTSMGVVDAVVEGVLGVGVLGVGGDHGSGGQVSGVGDGQQGSAHGEELKKQIIHNLFLIFQ